MGFEVEATRRASWGEHLRGTSPGKQRASMMGAFLKTAQTVMLVNFLGELQVFVELFILIIFKVHLIVISYFDVFVVHSVVIIFPANSLKMIIPGLVLSIHVNVHCLQLRNSSLKGLCPCSFQL